MGRIDPTSWAVFALALFATVFFIARGVRRYREAGAWRGIAWWVGALMGIAFVGLGVMAVQFEEPARGTFSFEQQAVRWSVLVTGVVVLVYTLSAVLPMSLDALERRAFVSFVSARLIRATKSGFLTVISVLSMLGVAVSSCALCSVTSIMGGFGHDLKKKILGNTAHIVIDVPKPGGYDRWQPVLEVARREAAKHGGAVTAVIGGEAMASSATNTAGTLVRGVDAETIGSVIRLKDNIEVGRFDYLTAPAKLTELPASEVIGRGPGGEPYMKGPGYRFPGALDPELRHALRPKAEVFPGIILGRELAKSLHVMVGDELTLLSPMGELGPTGIMPRARKFRVAAIFYSGMYEYDASHGYVLRDEAETFFDMKGRVSNIDVRIPEPELVDGVTPAVRSAVTALEAGRGAKNEREKLRVRDWKEMNRNLFSALKLEKIATFIILSIAIAVASFCIICTLLLMVTEKTKEIAVLKALGAAENAIMKVFMLEGVIIGAIGTTFGVFVALAACLGLSWTGVRLDPDVYYIDRLPVNVDPFDYAMVAIASLAICTLSTVLPSVAAAQVQPVDGLRYE
jgi:lipoprotein-releasing system permease protein